MEKNISIYSCKLVREGMVNYHGEINQAKDVVEAAKALGIIDFSEEVFSIFYLNAKGKITGYSEVSRGDLSSTLVHPREVFKRAVVSNCSALILLHNHPSDDVHPSYEDKATTRRLVDAGKLLGIRIIDHIIVGPSGVFYSMSTEGVLDN